jgi:hypothetical protein
VSSTALEDHVKMVLGRDLQPSPAWSKVGERLLKRQARRQWCGDLVAPTGPLRADDPRDTACTGASVRRLRGRSSPVKRCGNGP